MKRLFFLLFFVLVLYKPCYAFVVPNGIFSIENTLWNAPLIDMTIGFSGGKIYACDDSHCVQQNDPFYVDLFLISFFQFEGAGESYAMVSGILFSWLGIGSMTTTAIPPPFNTLSLNKVSDIWMP